MSGDNPPGPDVNHVIRKLAETPSLRKRKRILDEELAKLSPQDRADFAGWIAAFRMTQPQQKSNWERIVLFITAVGFLVVLLVLAVFIPNPTVSQSRTFNTILALMAGGFGAFVPGEFGIKIKGPGYVIRGTLALGLILLVYFWSPA